MNAEFFEFLQKLLSKSFENLEIILSIKNFNNVDKNFYSLCYFGIGSDSFYFHI